MGEANVTNAAESRTGIHILGAFGIAALMGIALALIPLQRARQGGWATKLQRAARGDLELLARAEKDFKAKHGSYTTDLNALIVTPKNVLYKFGFSRAGDKIEGLSFEHRPEVMHLDALKAAVPRLDMTFSPVTKLAAIDFASEAAKYCAECTATRESFKAIAIANLDDDADLDVWTIDERGEVRHVVNDLP